MNLDQIDLRIAAVLREMETLRLELAQLRSSRARLAQDGAATSGTSLRGVRPSAEGDDEVTPFGEEAPTVHAKGSKRGR